MQVFLRDGARGSELALLNRCRMYLQVVFISEICNGTGTQIAQHYWEGQKTTSISPYNWPRTHIPTQAKWNVWRQRLTSGLSLGQSQTLALPLGQWKAHMRERPGYFIEVQGNHLLSLQDEQWRAHTRIPHRRRRQEYYKEGIPREPPQQTEYLE